MSVSLTDVERLLPLLEMAFQVEQVKMGKIVSRMADLKKQLDDLNRPSSVDPLSLATRAGADMRWATWVEHRKTLINKELAKAAQERERARANVAAALSKLDAARQLQARAVLEARRLAERRAIN